MGKVTVFDFSVSVNMALSTDGGGYEITFCYRVTIESLLPNGKQLLIRNWFIRNSVFRQTSDGR